MKYHTFVCGTSKSKREDAYYIRAKNRFWHSLYEVGITERQLKPREYRTLGRKYGIYLTEIVDPEKHIINGDKKIKPFHLKDGFRKLISRIEDEKPRRIGFVGKNATTWFYRHMSGLELTKHNYPAHRRVSLNLGDYGLLDWKFKSFHLSKEIEYWLLTNTHRHWKREIWLDFWQHCKHDVDQFIHARELE